MIGLDTNVLLRYVLRDDPAQTDAARRIVEEECTQGIPGYINHIVLCEFVWTLASAYRYKAADVIQLIRLLLMVDRLRVEAPHEVAAAISDYSDGYDFADSLIGQANRRANCKTTLTFDRRASRLPFMECR